MNFFHVTCFISIFIVIATRIASNDPPPVNAEDTSDNVQVFYEDGWFKRVGGAISEIPQDPDNEESTIHPEASPPPSTTTSTPPNLLQPHHSHELGAYFFLCFQHHVFTYPVSNLCYNAISRPKYIGVSPVVPGVQRWHPCSQRISSVSPHPGSSLSTITMLPSGI